MAGPECSYLERFQAGFNKAACKPSTDQSRALGVVNQVGSVLAKLSPFPEVQAAVPGKLHEQPAIETIPVQPARLTDLPIPRDAWQAKTFVGDIVLKQEAKNLGAFAKTSVGRSLSELFFTDGRDKLVGEALSPYLTNAQSPDHAYQLAYRALELALTEMQGNALAGRPINFDDTRQLKALLISTAQAARRELSNNV